MKTQNIDTDLYGYRPFANQIARVIESRSNINCLTIGVYGEWGQGKTTTLGYVEDRLNQSKVELQIIKFNPWIYPKEEDLLFSFFDSIYKSQ